VRNRHHRPAARIAANLTALRISPREAVRRVRAAANLGPRRGLTGSVLPPLVDGVAAAQAAGLISAEHAAVIITTIDRLPGAVGAEREAGVQAQLVEHATDFDPHQLATLAGHLTPECGSLWQRCSIPSPGRCPRTTARPIRARPRSECPTRSN
jgi:hypothetical protein